MKYINLFCTSVILSRITVCKFRSVSKLVILFKNIQNLCINYKITFCIYKNVILLSLLSYIYILIKMYQKYMKQCYMWISQIHITFNVKRHIGFMFKFCDIWRISYILNNWKFYKNHVYQITFFSWFIIFFGHINL